MYTTSISTLLPLLLSVAAALPTSSNSARDTPKVSQGIRLRAWPQGVGSDAPDVSGFYLGLQRVSQGVYLSTVIQPSPEAAPAVFFIDGDSTADATLAADGTGPLAPLRLVIQPPSEQDPSYPGEHNTGFWVASAGTGGVAVDAASLALTGPAGDRAGMYAACARAFPAGSDRELILPRYVYDGERIPHGCTPVEFRAECADLSGEHDSALDSYCS
ncbi:hypothetical protein F4778DRAFT_731121 [Xylariomycetidae sp. FL2044]|nr:hypothetical protein F4778DRAFT_731121 [Xylariomycetidae sp. FL2044]